MLRKIISISLAFVMCLGLCGCDFFATDTAKLLSPPALSGDLNPIAQSIEESVGKDYTFKYPSRGNYRSAVVREDINGDGLLEAFAFYSTTDSETVTMNLNYICLVDGNWESLAQQKLVAGGVDMLEFCDLDNDGISEMLVGWEIYGTSEMQLAVYSMAENSLNQRMLKRYTHFTTCDLNEDGKKEIFVINANSAESINTAAIYELSQNGVTELSTCELDSTAKTLNAPISAPLSSGKPAIYIDEIKGVGAVTEVLFMEKGKLVNPLFQPDKRETLATLRSVNFSTADMNDDGIPEIPVQKDVPSVTRSQLNEKLYLTEWCSFNGEKLTTQQTTMINVNDGYYYIIPSKWVNNIAVLKDTDNHIREIYRYSNEEIIVNESLLYIKAVEKSDWDSGKYKSENLQKITTGDETVFVCRISHLAEQEGLTIDTVRASFRLFEQE